MNIAIKIRAGEHDDQWQLGVTLVEPLNGVGATTGVKRDQDIARFGIVVLIDSYPMAELLQHGRPALGGNLVAVVEGQRRRSDQLYFHAVDYFAQVRNPAQTSRRSGV